MTGKATELTCEAAFENCRNRALKTIRENEAALKQVQLPKAVSTKFELCKIDNKAVVDEIYKEVEGIASCKAPAIYCLELIGDCDYPTLRQKFMDKPENCENSGEKLSYSRLNDHKDREDNEDQKFPGAIYVGSSRKFLQRFSQHLGWNVPAGTYSMRLRLWAAGDSAKVKLSVWFFKSEIDGEWFQLLEQALWDEKRPLLGKRSGH